MHNIIRTQLFALMVVIAFYITYAYAASNSNLSSMSGEGATVISGWDVSNVHYLMANHPSNIAGVEFDLNALADVVRVSFSSQTPVFFDCENTIGFHWICRVQPSMSISEANELRVIATGG